MIQHGLTSLATQAYKCLSSIKPPPPPPPPPIVHRLYVGYNGVSDASLQRLAVAVEHNYSLTHLAVWGNDTGVETSKVRSTQPMYRHMYIHTCACT